jgi:hypothetical protein
MSGQCAARVGEEPAYLGDRRADIETGPIRGGHPDSVADKRTAEELYGYLSCPSGCGSVHDSETDIEPPL